MSSGGMGGSGAGGGMATLASLVDRSRMTRRARDYDFDLGVVPTGLLNKITDVPGVTVGHATVRDASGSNTGLTLVKPCPDNPFSRKLVAASYVHNGFGKTCGTVQVDELGTLETPIALTNTLCVGRVADALVGMTLARCEADGVEAASINPVVGECNDSRINRISLRAVGEPQLAEADAAATADFALGDVGAGAGTICFGLKGGIGSASRVVRVAGREHVLGVLVQSNYGATRDLVLGREAIGRRIAARLEGLDGARPTADDRGSIMVVVATDAPLDARQLRRVLRRAAVGIARTGGWTGNGSGEVVLGFTTANRVEPAGPDADDEVRPCAVLREDVLDRLFRAAAEATHEAILDSMFCSASATALDGGRVHALAEFV